MSSDIDKFDELGEFFMRIVSWHVEAYRANGIDRTLKAIANAKSQRDATEKLDEFVREVSLGAILRLFYDFEAHSGPSGGESPGFDLTYHSTDGESFDLFAFEDGLMHLFHAEGGWIETFSEED